MIYYVREVKYNPSTLKDQLVRRDEKMIIIEMKRPFQLENLDFETRKNDHEYFAMRSHVVL